MRVGLLHAVIRAEEKLLLAAFEARGVDVERIHVESFNIDLSSPQAHAPFEGLDVVLERCVSHSRAAAVLRVLHTWGIPCVNPWDVANVCGDKLTTNLELVRAGVDPAFLRGAVLLVARMEEDVVDVPDVRTRNGLRVSISPVRTRLMDAVVTRLNL